MVIGELVEKIHGTPTKVVVITTGGGSEIFPTLLKNGGGSRTLLSGIIPYDTKETLSILGGKPDKMVSDEVARQLAMAAYQHAKKLDPNGFVIGVSCTASLQGVPDERDGRVHNIYCALQTENGTQSLGLSNAADYTSKKSTVVIRNMEEDLATHMMVDLIAKGCGLGGVSWSDNLATSFSDFRYISTELGDLLAGKIPTLCWDQTYGFITDQPKPKMLLSGSFNPVHAGHIEMAEVSKSITKDTCDYEMSIFNVDKPALDFITIKRRLMGFPKGSRVWLTKVPTFVEKAKVFPGTCFAIGYDTAVRIIDPKYAGDIDHVVEQFKKTGTTFLVFGRKHNDQDDLSIETFPHSFRKIATEVHKQMFYRNIASKDIRAGKIDANGKSIS